MGNCCAADTRNSECAKKLIGIFLSEPSIKIHRKTMVTWRDIGQFDLDFLLQEFQVRCNVYLNIVMDNKVVENELYFG